MRYDAASLFCRLRTGFSRKILWGAGLAIAALIFSDPVNAQDAVSGRLVNGFRVLSAADLAASPDIFVFRGDYIKFESGEGRRFSVPGLGIAADLPENDDQAPYFKMKQTGTYDYSLGRIRGTIRVREYKGAHYQVLTAQEARKVIKDISPLILDVRTPGEYQAGRIEDSHLIPVQVLQQNLSALSAYKEKPILIYCATGNRSTVAAKILIDNGFKRIFNLGHGIKDWQKRGLPIVR